LAAKKIEIHPDNPQRRLVKQCAEAIQAGEVIIYPTDSCYAMGCGLGFKDALERIRRIRNLGKQHLFTLACNDIAQISDYAKVDNVCFRMIRTLTPGAYTFILPARNKVPRNLLHPTRKTIGMRIPDNAILQMLLEELGAPIMTTSLISDEEDIPFNDIDLICERFGSVVDKIVDGGVCGFDETTVIDMVSGSPELVRQGKAPYPG
jgi:tRNA threonylcarbamoyl adenosine modification protein (Sua5/YciO/YrdC/YwlC family)